MSSAGLVAKRRACISRSPTARFGEPSLALRIDPSRPGTGRPLVEQSARHGCISMILGARCSRDFKWRGSKAGGGSRADAYEAYDAAILVDPSGKIVIHHRQVNVVLNAFDPAACQSILNRPQCSYTQGEKEDVKIVMTPFGRTALLVCADAYTYAGSSPGASEVPCTGSGDRAVGHYRGGQRTVWRQGFQRDCLRVDAARYLESAFVVGANATGERTYGRFLPSVYCGDSGYATPLGEAVEAASTGSTVLMVHVPDSFQAPAPTIDDAQSAPRLCPGVCGAFASAWNGQWTPQRDTNGGSCGCTPNTGQ